jgi:hypothetical protein
MVLEMIGLRIGMANDHRIRVVKPGLLGPRDPNFRIAVEWLAGFAAEHSKQQTQTGNRNDIVPVRGPGHSMHRAAKVFVLYRADLLTSQILGDADFGRFYPGCHGGTLAQAAGPGKPKAQNKLRNSTARSRQFKLIARSRKSPCLEQVGFPWPALAKGTSRVDPLKAEFLIWVYGQREFVGKGMGTKEWFQKSKVGLHSLAPIPLPFRSVVVISIREWLRLGKQESRNEIYRNG